jgi:hypothetical protein
MLMCITYKITICTSEVQLPFLYTEYEIGLWFEVSTQFLIITFFWGMTLRWLVINYRRSEELAASAFIRGQEASYFFWTTWKIEAADCSEATLNNR